MPLNQHFTATQELGGPGESVTLLLTVTEPDGEELTPEQNDRFQTELEHMFSQLVDCLKERCMFEPAPDVEPFKHGSTFETPTGEVSYQLEVSARTGADAALCELSQFLHTLSHLTALLDHLRQPVPDSPLTNPQIQAALQTLRESGIEVAVVGPNGLAASLSSLFGDILSPDHEDSKLPVGQYL